MNQTVFTRKIIGFKGEAFSGECVLELKYYSSCNTINGINGDEESYKR